MMPARRRAAVYPVWLPDGAPRGRPAPRRSSRMHPMVGVTAMVVLLTLPALLYVAQRVRRAEAGYSILRLQGEVRQLRVDNARLLMQVAALKAPQRIERIATTELGMVPPHQRQLATITVAPAMAQIEPSEPRRGVVRFLTSWLGRSEAEARERVR